MGFVGFYKPLNYGIAPADPNGYHAKRNKKHNYKHILRFDFEGNYIGEIKFNSAICKEAGLNYDGIRLASRPTWCEKRRTLSSMDSIWIIKEDYSQEELNKKVKEKQMDSNINPKANKRSRKVIQRCALTQELIKTWDSVNQAGKEEKTGYSLTSIYRVLSGERKTYAGCTWEYAS